MNANKLLGIALIYFCSFLNIKAMDVNGFYVTLSKDTVKCKMRIPYLPNVSIAPNFRKLQRSIEIYDKEEKKQEFKPNDILAFGFYFFSEDFDVDTIVFVSRKTNLVNSKSFLGDENVIFLHLIIKGELSLYQYYSMSTMTSVGFNGMNSFGTQEEIKVLGKENEGLYICNPLKFKESLSEYFSDCPSLAKKIQDKVYKIKQLWEIVKEFNKVCSN